MDSWQSVVLHHPTHGLAPGRIQTGLGDQEDEGDEEGDEGRKQTESHGPAEG